LEKIHFSFAKLGLAIALLAVMLSYDSIYKKMASSLGQNGAGHSQEPAHKFDPSRHIAPIVAHELNNILTIVQGYADRLLIKHGEEPALQPHLKLISEAAKRAGMIIREAAPPNASQYLRHITAPQPPVV
jgi:signal transduction histidine kinase